MRMKILEEEMNGENVLFEMQKKGRLTGEPESPVEYLFKEIMGDEIKKGEKIENIQPDFLHVSEKIVFEIDGKDYHSSKEQLESDEKRNKIYMLNGWQVIRITGKTTMKDTEALKSMLSTIIRTNYYETIKFCTSTNQQLQITTDSCKSYGEQDTQNYFTYKIMKSPKLNKPVISGKQYYEYNCIGCNFTGKIFTDRDYLEHYKSAKCGCQ